MNRPTKSGLLFAVAWAGAWAVWLGGCTIEWSHTTEGGSNISEPEVAQSEESFSYGSVRLKEFALRDGTPCAALVGRQVASMSCGWK